jgi:LysM repeat protein
VATGAAGAALPFAVASAATPAAPPAPPRTLSATALRVPAAQVHKAARKAVPGRYTVRPGDTLSSIARRFCGTASAYPDLAANSAIADANLIYPGEAVRLACRAAASAVAKVMAASAPPAAPRQSVPVARPVAHPVAHPVSAPVTTGAVATVDSAGGTLSCAGLQALWDAAGGNPADAFMAAEIAMAESGGRQYALSPTDDLGYWQINASNGALATYSALGNAKSAIILSDDGANWGAWTTYTEGLYQGRC